MSDSSTSSGLLLTPGGLLHAASKQVPTVRYAIGVGGVAAVVAIVLTIWKLDPQTAAFGTLGVFVFMVVLVIFAALSKASPAVLKPLSLFLAWAFLLLAVAVACLFVACAFFDTPKSLPCLLKGECGPDSNRQPSPTPRPSETSQPTTIEDWWNRSSGGQR